MVGERPQSLPKTLQVSEMLIREIASGRLPDGARLPTERKLAEELGIAVGTLRRALAILEEKGLLRRIQGSGNYVQSKPDVQSVYGFFRLELIEGGGLPTAKVLELLRLRKEDHVPEIGPGSLGHRIRRLRSLNETVIAVEEVWLDGRFSDWIYTEDLSESLYYFYKEKLKLIINQAEDRLGVSNVPDWAPAPFGLKPGDPAGYIERISYAADGKPAEFSMTWFNHNVARYTNRLK